MNGVNDRFKWGDIMGLDIGKIGGADKIFKTYQVNRKKEVKEVANVDNRKDELSISQKAMDYSIVNKGINIIKAMPDIREDKVKEIKDRMEKGIYNVDGKDVAEKILADRFDKKI